jgi:hypothetical protein
MPRAADEGVGRAFTCPHCEKPATAVSRGAAVWGGIDEQGRVVNPPAQWTLVQCERCEQPTLEVREDYGDGFEVDDPVFVYPTPHRMSPNVPSDLRREWAEARACFQAKAYTACLVMVRRTLEGTCEDQGVKKRTLVQPKRARETGA